MTEKERALLKEIRALARERPVHGFKRRHADWHRKRGIVRRRR